MDEPTLYFNGVDGASGGYATAPISLERFAAQIRRQSRAPEPRELGVKSSVDACDLGQAGWGVIFPHDVEPAVREALEPLLAHRRTQASRLSDERFRELVYLPGESKMRFLSRYEVAPGVVDPDLMPYYLLLVGGPERLPFAFQYQLGVQYAVGRIAFDTPEEYAAYARGVLGTELQPVERSPRTVFFGVENPDDKLTQLSVDHLVMPLVERLAKSLRGAPIEAFLGAAATKDRLARLLGGDDTPEILFTASHGVLFHADDPDQADHQGALICAEWPGPKAFRERLPSDFFFAGDDVAASAQLGGLISFHFACYTAGTPIYQSFATDDVPQAHAELAARLPQRLLGHPRGGALAVVGHVDRAWQHSFVWDRLQGQVQTFESALWAIARGRPVGAALAVFGERHAEIASERGALETAHREGLEPADDLELGRLWTAYQDARSYVLLGDPAVRLPTPPSKEGAP